MKNFIWVSIVFAVISFTIFYLVSSLPTSQEMAERTANRRTQQLQLQTNHVVSEIQYIKDPRTDLCFAYSWIGKGKTMATVPCEAIPENLLTVAGMKSE